jgi:hypothetical protein
MHPVSFYTSLMQVGSFMLVMVEIFSGLASMPRWLMMKPSSFPEGMPKMHLLGLSFHWYSRRDAHVGVSGLNDHVVHVGVTPAFLAPNKSPNKSRVFSKLSSRAQLPSKP